MKTSMQATLDRGLAPICSLTGPTMRAFGAMRVVVTTVDAKQETVYKPAQKMLKILAK